MVGASDTVQKLLPYHLLSKTLINEKHTHTPLCTIHAAYFPTAEVPVAAFLYHEWDSISD